MGELLKVKAKYKIGDKVYHKRLLPWESDSYIVREGHIKSIRLIKPYTSKTIEYEVVGPYTCFILTESEIYDTQKEVLASIKK